MSVAVPKARQEGVTIPEGVDSARAKLVYLYLATAEPATVDDLAERLGMQKMALFSVLGTLDAGGHVARGGARYRVD